LDIDGDSGRETSKLVERAGGNGTFVEADVSDSDAVRALGEHCDREHGRVDVLFNNAAIGVNDTVESFDLEQWDRVMAVDVKGPLLCAQVLASQLAASGHGSIINHSSIDGVFANPHAASYSAAKAALNGLTRLMAHTYGKVGIRTNSISSGNLTGSASGAQLSRIADGLIAGNPLVWTRMAEKIVENTPGGRVGTLEEAASVALFFASDDSAYVNGVDILVTGGRGALTPGTTVD
jgi:NAD(P)-dependent dehydrogenase (short-subunit alcohol dehydrogenase family)